MQLILIRRNYRRHLAERPRKIAPFFRPLIPSQRLMVNCITFETKAKNNRSKQKLCVGQMRQRKYLRSSMQAASELTQDKKKHGTQYLYDF
ncbi:hypothetical protein DPEC_G00004210, partial [Dallia pectoralis]